MSLLSRFAGRALRTTSHKSATLSQVAAFSSSSAQGRLRLENKTAVVTGAAGGIGRESCLLFAQEGAKVVCADIDASEAEKTAEAITAAGGEAIAMYCDVSNEAQVEALMALAEKEFGSLDVVFNNAGVMLSGDGTAEETNDQVWDVTNNINVKGVWYGCKHALPGLRRSGGGSIINTGSFVGMRGAATSQLAYTASKGAVLALTRELSVVHARENIRFNSLCPGPLNTELLQKFLDTEAKKQRRLVHLPMGRFGEAEEMAKAALFLASDDSSYVNGTDFLVDGGLCAAYVTAE